MIEGGVRIKGIKTEWAQRADKNIKDLTGDEKKIIEVLPAEEKNRILAIRLNTEGDFSTYTLRLIRSARSADMPELPPVNFDSILSKVDFSFKVECMRDFDCKSEKECPPEILYEPTIDYMAKDFASFRRVMLDRLSVVTPDWKERNPADIGVVLIELLAYVGDHLSYYQDAVATEAYLGTARKRVSIRRHARLLDYLMHDGCNARAWIHLEVDENETDGVLAIPKKTKLLTGRINNNHGIDDNPIIKSNEDFEHALNEAAEPFETMHDIIVYAANNKLFFYTWGDLQCCLPPGATSCTIRNDNFMFNWDNVSTSKTESDRLKDFLKKNFHDDDNDNENSDNDLNWITDSQLEKIDNNKTIRIANGTNSLSIQLDDDITKATVKIGDKRVYDFIVEKINGDKRKINICNYQFDIYLFNWDNVSTSKTESDRLKDFLKKNFHDDDNDNENSDNDLNWITDSQLEKIDNNKTIRIANGTNSLSIQLDDDITKATVKIGDKRVYDFIVKKVSDNDNDGNNKNKNVFIRTLKVGDILIFEEVLSPPGSNKIYADPLKRHAVRLIEVTPNIDELNNTPGHRNILEFRRCASFSTLLI